MKITLLVLRIIRRVRRHQRVWLCVNDWGLEVL